MKKKILSLTGVLVLLLFNQVLAQDSIGVIDLEPITITGSRTEKSASDSSCAINVISGKDIEKSSAKDIPSLLENIEGVYVYDASGTGTSSRINMRGFWGGMSTHQLVLVDGVPQNSLNHKLVDWNSISLDNVEQIEVVKGAASALYGDNAMAGVINIITKRPSLTPKVKASLSYGTYNTSDVKVLASQSFGELGCLVSASQKLTDGFRDHSDYSDLHLNGKLRWDMKEDNLEFFLGYYQSGKGADSWAITEAQVEQDRRQARPGTENDKSEDKKIEIGLKYNKDLSGLGKLKSIFYFRDRDCNSFGSSTAAREYLNNENTYGLILQHDLTSEIFNLENAFTFGVDLERDEFDYQEYNAANYVRGAIRSDYNAYREKIGPFIQDEIKLSGPLTLSLGARYDLVKFNFKNQRNSANSRKEDLSDISPKVGLVYEYAKDSNLYGNCSFAFRTPTLGQMFTYSSANPELDPEEAVNYELGTRYCFNSFLKGNVSLFYTDLDNEIIYDYPSSKYMNYGQTSHSGVEARLDYEIAQGLKTFVNYAYLRAKDESKGSSNYLTNIPAHKGNLGISKAWNFGLALEGLLKYTGSSYLDSANTAKLSPNAAADVKISYNRDNWAIFLVIENILDREYNSYGHISSGTKYFSPAANRTFTFGVKAEF
ncbi:MAG: TonB-dependent receptor [Candidatus Omnitrophota bacterium]